MSSQLELLSVVIEIGGDERVDYGKVYQAMALLQQAGVSKVGLMSQPLSQEPKR